MDGAGTYTCNCLQNLTGVHCEGQSPGGDCVDGAVSYTCNCLQNLTGVHRKG